MKRDSKKFSIVVTTVTVNVLLNIACFKTFFYLCFHATTDPKHPVLLPSIKRTICMQHQNTAEDRLKPTHMLPNTYSRFAGYFRTVLNLYILVIYFVSGCTQHFLHVNVTVRLCSTSLEIKGCTRVHICPLGHEFTNGHKVIPYPIKC